MAHSKRSLTQKMEEELTCAVCCELYTCPLLLRCSHTFCKKCIQDLVRNNDLDLGYGVRSSSFKCPVCRADISLKSARGINDLPENLALANLIGILKSSDEIKTLFSKREVPALKIPKCAWHPDSDCTVDRFCADCFKVYCRLSIPQSCLDHDWKKSDGHWTVTWKRVHRLMNEAGEKMSSLIDRVHLLDDHLVAIERQESSAKSELKAEIEILESMLKSRLAQLCGEIHRDVQGMRYPVIHDRDECSAQLEEIEALMMNIEKLQQNNDGIRSIRTLMKFEKDLTNQLSENAHRLLSRSIPVVTMPTWKLLRENTETSIRTLITRRTGPFPSPPSTSARSPSVKTSTGKQSFWTDSLPSDVTMKSSPSNSGNNNPASKPWPQKTTALSSSKSDQRITSSNPSLQQATNKNNSAARGVEQISLRSTALRPSAQVNKITSVLSGSEPSRNLFQQTPSASSSSFIQAAGQWSNPNFSASSSGNGRRMAMPSRRSTASGQSGSGSVSNRSSASGVTTLGTSLSNNMDSIISSLRKIEVKVEEWDSHANKKIKKKNTSSEFNDFGTTIPNSFQFQPFSQASASSVYVFNSPTNTTQKKAQSKPSWSQGAPAVSTVSMSLFPSLASKLRTGKPATTTSSEGFSFRRDTTTGQSGQRALATGFSIPPHFDGFSLTNPLSSQSSPFLSTSSSNNNFSFPATQTKLTADSTTGIFSSSNFLAGNTVPSIRRPTKTNKPKSRVDKKSPNFFMTNNNLGYGAFGQNSNNPIDASKKGDQTKAPAFSDLKFSFGNDEKASEGSAVQSPILSVHQQRTQTSGVQDEAASSRRSESGNQSQSPLGSFLLRRIPPLQEIPTKQDHSVSKSLPAQDHLEGKVTEPKEAENLQGQDPNRLGRIDSGDMNEIRKVPTEISRDLNISQANEERGTSSDTILDDCSSVMSSGSSLDLNVLSSLVGETIQPGQVEFVSSVPNNSNSRTAPVMSALVAQSHHTSQNGSLVSANRSPFSTVGQQNSADSPSSSSVDQYSGRSEEDSSQYGEAKPGETIPQEERLIASKDSFTFNLSSVNSQDEHDKPANGILSGIPVQGQNSASASLDSYSFNLSSEGRQDEHDKPASNSLSRVAVQERSSGSASSESFSFSLPSHSSKDGQVKLADNSLARDQFSFKLPSKSTEEKPTFKFGESRADVKFSFQPSSNSASSSESVRNGFDNLFGNITSETQPKITFGFPSTTSAESGEKLGSGLFQFGMKEDN